MRAFAALAVLASAFAALPGHASPPAPTEAPAPRAPAAEPTYEMFKVQLVLLETGPNREETPADDPRQAEHLAGLERLLKERKALIVGPVEDGGDLRGLVVLDVETAAEAEKLLAADPWVASGRLVPEFHTWFVAKKLFQPLVGPFRDVERCTLGLLVRPDGAPDLPADERKTIQAGHMANIHAMADAGELAIAGPLVEDTKMRGVFVFRTIDRARIETLVAADPAVSRGLLKLEPYTWLVSKGVLPPR